LNFKAKRYIIVNRELGEFMNIDDQKQLAKEVTTGKRKTLGMNDKFKFQCNGCGKCCFNNDIVLNVYDVIRLRHGLKKPTQDILKEAYLNFYIGPSSGLPIVSLNFKKLNDAGFSCCPFLVPALNFNDVMAKLKEISKGDEVKFKELIEQYKTNPSLLKKDLSEVKVEKWLCLIHNDRPIICRLFPCGRLQEINKKTKEVKEHFILQDDEKTKEFCPGFKTEKETSLDDFLALQNFWHSKEGSATFTRILDTLVLSGFFATTSDNKNSKPAPMFEENSKVMMFLGNLLYNFDSFNAFSKDPRVLKTIYDEKATQEDFMYVENKVLDIVMGFTKMLKSKNPAELDFQQFINSLTKGGEILNDK
jgi:Fe-S-cluster containining protein